MVSLLRNQKVRSALLQVVYVGSLAALVLAGIIIARRNLAEQGITSGFDFLYKSTGWDVNFSLLPATANDPYWWFFLIGIINTLFLGCTGLILATLVGTIVGLARTSSNELARLLGRTYVDIFRNIPLILQVFFWYALITHLPTPRAAHEAWGFLLTSRGLYVPAPNVGGMAMALATSAVIAAIALPVWLGRTSRLSQPFGQRATIQLAGAAAALACAAIVLVVGRLPDAPLLDFPALEGLNLRGGLRVPPEFSALAIAIAIYGGSYIAEIVRGGFKSVGMGQMEAARSLGLSPWRVFTLVRLPLALRAMLPILANQYVWLMKATTMGIAVGFTDFFMIVALTINHSGQTLEVIGILMGGFLAINLSLAAVFNRINKAIALKGNQLRG
ncbi:ABC transporter permease subunit [Mesorhizobium sp. CA18]|uniref:amino acid ABC transporter permease n=1 Tax=unclassified Mesorhizobium TaxID=325217 RepID=UPI001CCAFD74|nr:MULTISPECIES: ABC transporter permease subunit [unclassified Mesorhizobium]MBZ9733527.1 ABC transporter permease subunit [Mesorhizobium sp. CA9]MBZ9824192.1 ABC transporter permease subunit [Mesorhizobium sp. CA18]MBZ9831322.1 ABC transporter permease subunit [Mesorhizobium sp. CA2]MBZ9837486.1 ABC transporter permease subunit [Mesorhizobium sp. CA3]MBZ9877230.1 ABC transporter permease subunit [Mesorhizobium sp. Ca11]